MVMNTGRIRHRNMNRNSASGSGGRRKRVPYTIPSCQLPPLLPPASLRRRPNPPRAPQLPNPSLARPSPALPSPPYFTTLFPYKSRPTLAGLPGVPGPGGLPPLTLTPSAHPRSLGFPSPYFHLEARERERDSEREGRTPGGPATGPAGRAAWGAPKWGGGRVVPCRGEREGREGISKLSNKNFNFATTNI